MFIFVAHMNQVYNAHLIHIAKKMDINLRNTIRKERK